MKYHPLGDGRYLMRLDPGDEMIASLRLFASEESVTAGYITGLGSTASAVMSWLDPELGEYVRRKFDEPMEVAHAQRHPDRRRCRRRPPLRPLARRCSHRASSSPTRATSTRRAPGP